MSIQRTPTDGRHVQCGIKQAMPHKQHEQKEKYNEEKQKKMEKKGKKGGIKHHLHKTT